jgi:hypothetical protein
MSDNKGMMYDGLIRCPFCYSENTDTSGFINHKDDCWLILRYMRERDKNKIRKAWNSRPIEDALRAENERLREALDMLITEVELAGDYGIDKEYIRDAQQALKEVKE